MERHTIFHVQIDIRFVHMGAFSDASVPVRMSCNVCEKGILQNQDGLHTFSCLLLGSHAITQEVSKLRSNHNLMLLKSLGIKPHEAQAVHVLEKSDLVFIGDVLPIGAVLPILAELMGVGALPLVGAEIHANAGTVLQRALIR